MSFIYLALIQSVIATKTTKTDKSSETANMHGTAKFESNKLYFICVLQLDQVHAWYEHFTFINSLYVITLLYGTV